MRTALAILAFCSAAQAQPFSVYLEQHAGNVGDDVFFTISANGASWSDGPASAFQVFELAPGHADFAPLAAALESRGDVAIGFGLNGNLFTEVFADPMQGQQLARLTWAASIIDDSEGVRIVGYSVLGHAVPEPASFLLAIGGLVAFAWRIRR